MLEYEGRIRIIRQRNRGTANALNTGFRNAAGSYIAWLSSDDRFRFDKIEQQIRFMQQSGYSISHTAFWKMDSVGTVERKPIILPESSLVQFYRTLLVSNSVNGCTVMMTRSLFTRMGGFNENLPYTHDYELWIRTILAGFPIGYLNQPLTEYRIHPAMGSLRHHKAIQKEIASILKTYSLRLERLLSVLQHSPTP